MVDDSGSSCEMCGKKQDFSSSGLTTTTSPKSNKPRTHFYFHKSDESSDSNDDLCGDLSWSGEQNTGDGVPPKKIFVSCSHQSFISHKNHDWLTKI